MRLWRLFQRSLAPFGGTLSHRIGVAWLAGPQRELLALLLIGQLATRLICCPVVTSIPATGELILMLGDEYAPLFLSFLQPLTNQMQLSEGAVPSARQQGGSFQELASGLSSPALPKGHTYLYPSRYDSTLS